MFNLIISIIAIALVVALAAATLYYGGASYNEANIKAQASRILNEGNQIKGGITLYKATGGSISSDFTLDTLVSSKILKSIPEGWGPSDEFAVLPVAGSKEDKKEESICFTANKMSGFEFSGDLSINDSANYIEYSQDINYALPYCSDDINRAIPCCVTK